MIPTSNQHDILPFVTNSETIFQPTLELEADLEAADNDEKTLASFDTGDALLLSPMAPTGLPGSVNATAYRIFKILVWLNQTPLSVDELNERFCGEPAIGKRLSSDSIWLYINTLKALGCDIRRPTRSNHFRYELVRHPFGLHLGSHHLALLSEIKTRIESDFSHEQILLFDQLLKKIISRSSLLHWGTFFEELFYQSRSRDYQDNRDMIEALEQAIIQGQLLSITYVSPVRGHENLYCLPESLLYQRGVLYLMGHQDGRSEASMLRVDRIEAVETLQQPEIYERLLAMLQQEHDVVIRFYGTSIEQMPSFELNEQITPFETEVDEPDASEYLRDKSCLTHEAEHCQGLEMCLKTRHMFLLRQKILESGLSFQVIKPTSFGEDLLKTLKQMASLYEGEHSYA